MIFPYILTCELQLFIFFLFLSSLWSWLYHGVSLTQHQFRLFCQNINRPHWSQGHLPESQASTSVTSCHRGVYFFIFLDVEEDNSLGNPKSLWKESGYLFVLNVLHLGKKPSLSINHTLDMHGSKRIQVVCMSHSGISISPSDLSDTDRSFLTSGLWNLT